MFRRIPITSHLSQTRGWNGYYLSGDQLQEYFVNFAEEYDLEQFIKFETKVVSASWLEEEGQWPLNKWKWPAIEGLQTYKGILTHTANWDQDIDWKDKRVALIGVGSSGV
ncbi:hypothetical protein DTO164E3_3438 [Paecilomyces variotii]|nr:hypothetical protein DTO164E3_3438 [Paecilomyces variotii]KAJ9204867.1 hypothetical protein DTO032I3_2612 [Paecilomyces variotii]KAJ9279765.1 hypothetical protein DTO021D3_3270 [Paecilomyces variotii]KAJ9285773.1 hypothetical protein DTO021C3_6615 [Paecilomyces variotii]KAJ9342146.1 hypothetical protein DTO027B6_5392 [Paecilomyces variotii]